MFAAKFDFLWPSASLLFDRHASKLDLFFGGIAAVD
jgi:tRNA(His) 5'-end guanylyltransferase